MRACYTHKHINMFCFPLKSICYYQFENQLLSEKYFTMMKLLLPLILEVAENSALDQNFTNIFCTVNILGLTGHTISELSSAVITKGSCKEYVNETVKLCSNTTLFTKTGRDLDFTYKQCFTDSLFRSSIEKKEIIVGF